MSLGHPTYSLWVCGLVYFFHNIIKNGPITIDLKCVSASLREISEQNLIWKASPLVSVSVLWSVVLVWIPHAHRSMYRVWELRAHNVLCALVDEKNKINWNTMLLA